MAGVITYPVATPETNDLLLGTDIREDSNLTKNFTVGSIYTLMKQTGFSGLQIYEDNEEALTGGLEENNVYRKADGTLMVVFNP
jgi:hypothetical protein